MERRVCSTHPKEVDTRRDLREKGAAAVPPRTCSGVKWVAVGVGGRLRSSLARCEGSGIGEAVARMGGTPLN